MKNTNIIVGFFGGLALAAVGFVATPAEATTYFINQQPSCTITLREVPSGYPQNLIPSGGYPMLLTWGSSNAQSASISPALGSVPLEGARLVAVHGQQFSMSVYSTNGRTATCQTTPYLLPNSVSPIFGGSLGFSAPTFSTQTNYPVFSASAQIVPAPQYAAPASQVSLTQIPYTGADFGLVGTMLAWLSVITLASFGAIILAQRGAYMEKISARLKV